jgi:hypothetical protein
MTGSSGPSAAAYLDHIWSNSRCRDSLQQPFIPRTIPRAGWRGAMRAAARPLPTSRPGVSSCNRVHKRRAIGISGNSGSSGTRSRRPRPHGRQRPSGAQRGRAEGSGELPSASLPQSTHVPGMNWAMPKAPACDMAAGLKPDSWCSWAARSSAGKPGQSSAACSMRTRYSAGTASLSRAAAGATMPTVRTRAASVPRMDTPTTEALVLSRPAMLLPRPSA